MTSPNSVISAHFVVLTLIKKTPSIPYLFIQIANLFENNSSSEWLLYISEWKQEGQPFELSNLRVTTKVAVNALLGDTPALADYGTAIMHNLGTREVTAVVCIKYKQANIHISSNGCRILN